MKSGVTLTLSEKQFATLAASLDISTRVLGESVRQAGAGGLDEGISKLLDLRELIGVAEAAMNNAKQTDKEQTTEGEIENGTS